MAIVITNGQHYITYSKTGAVIGTDDINLAHQYANPHEAIKEMRRASGKTKGFYVFDTFTNRIVWQHMTNEEFTKMREERKYRNYTGKIARKTFSQDTRKLIYNNANGKCELCGRDLLFEDMTLDHIKPLSMGGADDVENLACTCIGCNCLKGNALPDRFEQRISDIFMYQMEKKHSKKLGWKIAHKLLVGMM